MNPAARLSGSQILSRSYAKRIIVSERNKFIYCPTPKVANSNWKYLIRKLEGYDDYMDLPKAHDYKSSGLRYLSDYSPAEVEHLLFRSDFYKFVFVRDPYTRVLSCYVDKFQNRSATKEDYQIWMGQLYDWKYVRDHDVMTLPRPSFRAFIDELLKQDPSRMNEHWMPQAYVCGFGEVPYDFVGRFERLKGDARKVLERLGFADEQFPTQAEIGFPATGSAKLVGDLYTLETMLKARLLYDTDFSILGY